MLKSKLYTRRHFVLVGAGALLLSRIDCSAQGAAPWLTLPATPGLPKPMREGLAPVNGIQVFFAQFGAGPPVILLHGGLANSDYWGNQIAELAKLFLVTVMDTRGHGRSPLTSDRFGYGLFAQDVVALMNHLAIDRAAIVGWSDGAITGIQLALTDSSRVSALFAFGANTDLNGLKLGGSKTGVFPEFAARCRREYFALSPNPKKWGDLQRGLIAMWRSEPSFSRDQLAKLRLPVMIADGAHDEIIKLEHTKRIAEAVKASRLKIFPDASHFAMLQVTKQFNSTLIDFLTEA
jgi:pimeloyl-ACP methyl ester carboxylesterase